MMYENLHRFSIGALAAIVAATLWLTAIGPANAARPPADFGSPPSGEIPILFNDRHIYSKPDTLKQGRVLSALVRGTIVLVPLRSLFEKMGAAVSYDPATKTVDVSKPGSDIKVSVGKPEVEINGEVRPLDVPPEMYRGTVVVPVRVISEGLGAYVQWVPDRHVVIIRYGLQPPPPLPPLLPPGSTPSLPPSPTPRLPASSTPTKVSEEGFVVGDYVFSPRVYNEFDPGKTGAGGSSVRGAVEFPLARLPWMIAGASSVCECDVDGRLGLKVADPRIYVGLGYMRRATNYYPNYGYPKISGVEFGVEKLPDPDQAFSLYGSAYYAPSVKGNFTDSSGMVFSLNYRILKYQVGGNLAFRNSPAYLDFGYLGDRETNKTNAPSNATHKGPYAGVGVRFYGNSSGIRLARSRAASKSRRHRRRSSPRE